MTATQFVDLLRRSQLLAECDLRHTVDLSQSADRIAASLVNSGLLTKWQAGKLLSRRFKGLLVGGYKILRPRGKGKLGNEFDGVHVTSNSRAVITIIPRNRVEDSTFQERLQLHAEGQKVHVDGALYFIISPIA